jgi:hypothetical protein
VRRLTSRIGRRLRWHPLSVAARLLTHALCNGLWRSLSPSLRRVMYEQHVLTWSTNIPDHSDSLAIVAYLRQRGLRVHEGGNAFYLPPQRDLADMLGPAVDRYPPGSGFKVLRDFRGLEEAHYLHPQRQTRLRRRLIGTPRDQLIAANYLHRLTLGPRVWDVCVLRAGSVSMPAFVVQHVEGTTPNARECAMFLQRLRTALAETELRISVPNWARNKDFRSPTCNGNLLRDAGGALNYIDFQNFALRNPRRIPGSSPYAWALARRLRTAGADAVRRFRAVRDLLSQQCVELNDRVVLEVGCNTGVMLHHALSAGAWWAVGWDDPAAAMQARAIALAQGFTRLDVVPADLSAEYDFGGSIPAWLGPHLDESIVLLLGTRQRSGIATALAELPWRALVCAAHHGESAMDVEERVRPFTTRGARISQRADIDDTNAEDGALLLLTREPTAPIDSARTANAGYRRCP